MRFFTSKPDTIPSPVDALPGRPEPIMKPGIHRVLGTPLAGPWPDGTRTAIFGLGWGLAGYCPGPALAALAGGAKEALLFVPAMLIGGWLQRRFATASATQHAASENP